MSEAKSACNRAVLREGTMQHIVCYSGGHSSALVAIEVARRYGRQDVVLLNHDIHPNVEDADVKRFKREVAAYLGIEITYASHPHWDTMDQFDVVMQAKAFKVGLGTALCTHRLKTEPFMRWLAANVPDRSDAVIYYGFDASEGARIQRRSGIMGAQGYRTDYPLATWPRSILSTEEIGIRPPLTYGVWKHANCIGCLKAGKQHWYAVFCARPDIFEKAKAAEDSIDYSILPDTSLAEIEPMFARMRAAGVEPTEKPNARRFWIDAKKRLTLVVDEEIESIPCECIDSASARPDSVNEIPAPPARRRRRETDR
jgi:hypothetical protein